MSERIVVSEDIIAIDLTDSFTLCDHSELANVIIELDDSPDPKSLRRKSNKSGANKTSKRKKCLQSAKSSKSNQEHIKKIGDCPVCLDELGKNQLAATKCGHVFCQNCIAQVVKLSKTCPTCRCVLKGTTAYHPIYLF